MASLWTEMKRCNVFRVSVLYSVAGWVLLQIADILFCLPMSRAGVCGSSWACFCWGCR